MFLNRLDKNIAYQECAAKELTRNKHQRKFFNVHVPSAKKKDFKANEITEDRRFESFQVCSGLVLENLMGAGKIQ